MRHFLTYGFNNNIIWVNDFEKEHIDNAICALATNTTLSFDLCNTGLPVLIPRDNGYLLFDDKQVENFVYFDNSELSDFNKILKRYSKEKGWKTPDISNAFLAEFSS